MTRAIVIISFLFAVAACVAGQTPSAVENEILAQLKEISRSGSYGEEFDEDKNSEANDRLRQTLIRNGTRLDILQYAFPKLKEAMYIATSPDRKLRVYSWDLETGGTMHEYDAVIQYQTKSGSVLTSSFNKDQEISAGAFTTQVFQLSTKAGPIYLANSTFIAQGNLHGQSIEVFRVNREKLERPELIRTSSGLQNSIDFSYDPFSLEERSERFVLFDAARRSFRFPIVVETREYENGRVTARYITYRFDGKFFVKAN
jgi:hypothetical protein